MLWVGLIIIKLIMAAMWSHHYPTPDMAHLSSEDYSWVYEPAEDTFLFLDALEKDIDTLNKLRYGNY